MTSNEKMYLWRIRTTSCCDKEINQETCSKMHISISGIERLCVSERDRERRKIIVTVIIGSLNGTLRKPFSVHSRSFRPRKIHQCHLLKIYGKEKIPVLDGRTEWNECEFGRHPPFTILITSICIHGYKAQTDFPLVHYYLWSYTLFSSSFNDDPAFHRQS